MKTYSECVALKTFKERFEYLMLNGKVGDESLGCYAYLKKRLYTSNRWKRLKNSLIIRDQANDLAVDGHDLTHNRVVLHHINPATLQQLIEMDPRLFDPENLICCSHLTHEAIHYSNYSIVMDEPIVRYPNDTSPWKR